jgi:hypothetical protein
MRYNYFLSVALLVLFSCTPLRRTPSIYEPKGDIMEVVVHEEALSIGPCEPSISINPTNTKRIIAGSVLDNTYISDDGGRSWIVNKMRSSHGVYGDPVVIHDKLGNPLYVHLSNSKNKAYKSKEFLDRIVVQRSEDNGKTWSDGSYPNVDHNKDHDKHWLYTDPISGDILMTWTEFDVYGSKEANDRSRILFSKSKDNGITWSDAQTISQYDGDCIDDDMTTEGAHPCIGTDGTYYCAWSYNEKIYMDISKDKGKTWLKEDIVVTNQVGGWTYSIPGIDRCNGMPVLKCDHSNGPNRGNLYINWSDQSNGINNTDIWLTVSKDKGKTWSKKIKVNDDSSNRHQFLTWMDIDNTDGGLYFVFYDRREHADNSTDVYLAYSQDTGQHFVNKRISKQPFIPNERLFFGDYNNISVHNGIVRPIWTAFYNEKLSVRTAIIDFK